MSLLNSFLQSWISGTTSDLDFRECPPQRPNSSDFTDQDTANNDSLLFDSVVEEDSDGHESSSASADLRVEKEDVGFGGGLRGRCETGREVDGIEERFSGRSVALDQDTTECDVSDDSSQAFLEGSSRTKDRNTAKTI